MKTLSIQGYGRRHARPGETREAILSAAANEFAGSGLAGARMDAIAAAAGVNKALLYYYFKSKESLYHAVIEDHFEVFNHEAIEVLTGPGPARAVLLRYVAMHFDFISTRLRYASLYQQMMMTGGKPLERLVKKYFVPRSQALGKLLERGMRNGEFRKTGLMHTAISIVSMIVFYFSAAPVMQLIGHADAYSKANLKRRKQEVLDFIQYGLFANPQSPFAMRRRVIIFIIIAAAIAAVVWYTSLRASREIVLTGIVTTDDVIVGPEVQGRLQELRVKEGDHVKKGDLLGVIQPWAQQADMSFYTQSEQQAEAQVKQAEANLENARLNFEREQDLYNKGVESKQAFDQARTANDSAKANLEALQKQMLASGAQKDKAQVQLDYTEIRAPLDSVVDVRAAYQGEVLNIGQAVVTLINEDDLWVRADVEETYIDRIHLKDKMKVRLPSGAEREGTVFFRGVDADYATQRDVSRTKRDIKTFEVRLRCDNSDRSLAVGMTAYVILPLNK